MKFNGTEEVTLKGFEAQGYLLTAALPTDTDAQRIIKTIFRSQYGSALEADRIFAIACALYPAFQFEKDVFHNALETLRTEQKILRKQRADRGRTLYELRLA